MSFFFNVLGLISNEYNSSKSNDLSVKLFEKMYERNKLIHETSIAEEKRIFLIDSIQNIMQHKQQLNSDLIYSNKECEEDMLEVSSQRFQSIILASSVMFGTLSSVIVDGSLPDGVDLSLVYPYAISSTLSFSFLFISIVLSIEVVIRTYSFMFISARHQSRQIKNGKTQAIDILNSFKTKFVSRNNDDKTFVIASLKEEDTSKMFDKHEEAYSDTLDQRGKIIETLSREKSIQKISFDDYWNKTCSVYGQCALLSFYLGTACLLAAVAVYMYAIFYYDHNSSTSSWVSISVISAGFLYFIYMKISNYFQNIRQNNFILPSHV